MEFPFGRYTNGTEVVAAVENIQYKNGGTRTGDGLKFIVDNFFSPPNIRDVPKVREEVVKREVKRRFPGVLPCMIKVKMSSF